MSCDALEREVPSSRSSREPLLLATDFDGTIAPIVDRPRDAVIHDCALRLLDRCSKHPSLAVAILSGRDVEDVRRRIGGLRAIVAGSHGLESFELPPPDELPQSGDRRGAERARVREPLRTRRHPRPEIARGK